MYGPLLKRAPTWIHFEACLALTSFATPLAEHRAAPCGVWRVQHEPASATYQNGNPPLREVVPPASAQPREYSLRAYPEIEGQVVEPVPATVLADDRPHAVILTHSRANCVRWYSAFTAKAVFTRVRAPKDFGPQWPPTSKAALEVSRPPVCTDLGLHRERLRLSGRAAAPQNILTRLFEGSMQAGRSAHDSARLA